jgi:glycosyltransferase involved in cell wall biosynthesis
LRHRRPQAKLPQLVLVGKHGWLYGETLRAVEQSSVAGDILLTGYVPEKDLPTLYSGALCFVYPSYFEGFGLPALEAMQCGAPVIAAQTTSLPEVVGDAGLLVDPFDESAISSALGKVIDDRELRTRMRVKGLDRARHFSWKRTAKLTLEIYQRAALAKGEKRKYADHSTS